jgi:hypothetical protein
VTPTLAESPAIAPRLKEFAALVRTTAPALVS